MMSRRWILSEYVTRPGKTGLIYTKYTCLYYGTYLLFCISYPKSVSFIEFPIDLCIYDDIVDAIRITDKKLLHFKFSKSGQILHEDKTCFLGPVTYLIQNTKQKGIVNAIASNFYAVCVYVRVCVCFCEEEQCRQLIFKFNPTSYQLHTCIIYYW